MDHHEYGKTSEEPKARDSLWAALEAAISVKVKTRELEGPDYRYRQREGELKVRSRLLLALLAVGILAYLAAHALGHGAGDGRVPHGSRPSRTDTRLPFLQDESTAPKPFCIGGESPSEPARFPSPRRDLKTLGGP